MDSQPSANTAYTPLTEDWTVINESTGANAYDSGEVVRKPRFAVTLPTSPISTKEMSFTFFSDNNDLDAEDEVIINDANFQVEALQESMDELKVVNAQLTAENADLRNTAQNLLEEVDRLKQKVDEITTNQIHKNHQIAALKLRVGGQMRLISRMHQGLFPHGYPNQYVGRGTFLNGREVYWRKASQSLWDEDVHAPVFGHGDLGCNFVLVQRCDPPRNSDEDTLVQAVGCHVTPGTLLKFKINDEEACFGF